MTFDEISIRGYRSIDLEALVELDESCFAGEFRFDRRSMRVFVEDRRAVVLIAEMVSGELAGFVVVHVDSVGRERVGYVVTLDVGVEWRRRGLAGRLMEEVEGRVAAAGGRRMELDVYAGNEGAIRFYEWMGYVGVGVRRGFYGAGLDALVYRKDLSV